MEKENYLNEVGRILVKEKIDLDLQLQILETVKELLNYYSVEFVRSLLPTFFRTL